MYGKGTPRIKGDCLKKLSENNRTKLNRASLSKQTGYGSSMYQKYWRNFTKSRRNYDSFALGRSQ